MKRLGNTLDQLTTPIFSRKGMYYAQLLSKWSEIVGLRLAAQCHPMKLSKKVEKGVEKGVLTLQVYSSAFATQLPYHLPTIREQIAQFFGFSLVDECRAVYLPAAQKFPLQAATIRPVPPATPTAKARLESSLAELDEDLATVLRSLGQRIFTQ